jgi:hypothetical protein
MEGLEAIEGGSAGPVGMTIIIITNNYSFTIFPSLRGYSNKYFPLLRRSLNKQVSQMNLRRKGGKGIGKRAPESEQSHVKPQSGLPATPWRVGILESGIVMFTELIVRYVGEECRASQTQIWPTRFETHVPSHYSAKVKPAFPRQVLNLGKSYLYAMTMQPAENRRCGIERRRST